MKRLNFLLFAVVSTLLFSCGSYSDEEQAAMVMDVIQNDGSSIASEMKKIMVLYDDQNIDGLYQMIADEDGSMEGMNDFLLDDRNKRWIPIIEKLIAEKSTFIAVGAGHLGGPNGVIRLLEAEGYTLTPIEL
jgi:uncharacterized protein YbaP (TraB family)